MLLELFLPCAAFSEGDFDLPRNRSVTSFHDAKVVKLNCRICRWLAHGNFGGALGEEGGSVRGRSRLERDTAKNRTQAVGFAILSLCSSEDEIVVICAVFGVVSQTVIPLRAVGGEMIFWIWWG